MSAPSNADIAALLRDTAAAMTIKSDRAYHFQILAHQRAADVIQTYPAQLCDAYKDGTLDQVPGLGPTMKAHLQELFATGTVAHFDAVMRGIPPAVFALIAVPTLGPKRAYQLVTGLHLHDPHRVLEDVAQAGQQNRIAGLPGFGATSQAHLLRAIEEYRLGTGKTTRMLLPYAAAIADALIAHLRRSPTIADAYPVGSLRRMKETIGDIDIAIAADDPARAIASVLAYPSRERTIEAGPATASMLLHGGTQVDVMAQRPASFGALLQHFTGSRAHNIHLRELAQRRGLSLSEYGIKDATRGTTTPYHTEADFYAALGLQWIPPEMREDTGEIERAEAHALPDLVTLQDIRGDLHLHSSYPIEPSHDRGLDPMERMVARAGALGYAYIGFAEHNPSVASHTSEQVYRILQERKRSIDALAATTMDLAILSLLEVDILPNGDLAIDERAIDLLDAMVVSIHSGFRMTRDAMTRRVLCGLSHPKAKILAHPTGRLINQRPGYALDWDALFAFVQEHGKALEINSATTRLDLPDTLVRAAVEHGVRMVIDTDSHAVAQMDLMRYGVALARRGWATKRDILNTLEGEAFVHWLKS